MVGVKKKAFLKIYMIVLGPKVLGHIVLQSSKENLRAPLLSKVPNCVTNGPLQSLEFLPANDICFTRISPFRKDGGYTNFNLSAKGNRIDESLLSLRWADWLLSWKSSSGCCSSMYLRNVTSSLRPWRAWEQGVGALGVPGKGTYENPKTNFSVNQGLFPDSAEVARFLLGSAKFFNIIM